MPLKAKCLIYEPAQKTTRDLLLALKYPGFKEVEKLNILFHPTELLVTETEVVRCFSTSVGGTKAFIHGVKLAV